MWVAVALFAVILSLLAYLDTRKPRNYPPGPAWLPLAGSALTVLRARKKRRHLYAATAEMSRRYGPVVGLKVGRDLVVIVYDPRSVREFLASEDLAGRPNGIFFKKRTWDKRRGLLLVDSDFWQEQRRFVLRQMREFGFGRRNMSSMIEEEAAAMVADVRRDVARDGGGSSATYDMTEFFGIRVLNTLWTMLAGIRYSAQDAELKRLQNILTDLFANIDMVGAPFSQFPLLRYLAPGMSGYTRYVAAHLRVWEFLYAELRRHRQAYDPQAEPGDLMDVYLRTLEAQHGKDDGKESSFSEQQLLALCMDMFMAGSETTSKTLGFCFLYLLLRPDVQKKAREEVDRVVGRERLPSLDDRPKMPYMECVVMESLRMFSGRAFTVPHRAMRDTHLSGYFIPKDAIVIANLNGCLMTPESGFPDPDAFEPERYMKEGRVVLPETFIPFGFGRHRCMGETLARANIFLLTASLLQNFNFAPSPEHPPLLDWVDGVTPGPVPFLAVVTPRDAATPRAASA